MDIVEVYPLNIVSDMFGADEAEKVYIKGLLAEIEKLKPRYTEVLRLRYNEKKTLKECGEIMGVGKERIRQLQAKSLRILKHPTRTKYYIVIPVFEVQELKEKCNRLVVEYELLKQDFELKLNENMKQATDTGMAELAVILATPLYEIDFSVRTHNCLIRSGKQTLKDLTEMTAQDYLKIRNLGKKSFEEVIYALAKYGLTIAELE